MFFTYTLVQVGIFLLIRAYRLAFFYLYAHTGWNFFYLHARIGAYQPTPIPVGRASNRGVLSGHCPDPPSPDNFGKLIPRGKNTP